MVLPESFVKDVIQHMNADHRNSLCDYASAFGGLKSVDAAELIEISTNAMTIRCVSGGETKTITIPLITEVKRPDQIRGVLVAMARQARQQILSKCACRRPNDKL